MLKKYPLATCFQSIILTCVIMLTGCSNPKDFEVSKLTDEQKKELGQTLTSDEGQKLAAWTFRNVMAGKELPAGTTVKMALSQQDEWLAKQKEEEVKAEALRKRVEAEQKAQQEEFMKLMSAVLISKNNKMQEYGQRWVGLKIAFENKSDKDIQGIKGTLKLADIFDDHIQSIGWSFDDGVPAKSTVIEKNSGVEINQFRSTDMKLWNTDFDKIKATFEVDTIIFKDGTKIQNPK